MKIEYDQQADAMYIRLRAGTVAESEEIRPGVVFDYDVEGKVLGIEMLDVSERTDNPRELATMGSVRISQYSSRSESDQKPKVNSKKAY